MALSPKSARDLGRLPTMGWPSWHFADGIQEWVDDAANLVRIAATAIVGSYVVRGYRLPELGLAIVDEPRLAAYTVRSSGEGDQEHAIVFTRGLLELARDCTELVTGGPGLAEVPDDSSEYAKHLFALVVAFLIECELSRIFSGHLGFLEQQDWDIGRIGATTFPDPLPGNALRDIRTLQSDADCTAMTRQMLWAFNHARSKRETDDLAGIRAGSPARLWFDQFVAMTLFFREIDRVQHVHDELPPEGLSPLLRLRTTRLVTGAVCSEYEINHLGDFDFGRKDLTVDSLAVLAQEHDCLASEVQAGALAAVADNFASSCLLAAGRQVRTLASDEAQAFDAEFQMHWQDLHPLLEPHAVMSLVGRNGHDPHAALRDVFSTDPDELELRRYQNRQLLLNLNNSLLGRAQKWFGPVASAVEEARKTPAVCGTAGCGGMAVQCHTIAAQSQLATIADDRGRVSWIPMRPRDSVGMAGDIFREQAVRSTLTFYGFCANCDASLFRDIDNPIDSITPEISLLLAYRSLAYSLWYLPQQEAGTEAANELLGISRPHHHAPQAPADSWAWNSNSRQLRFSELRWAIDHATLGHLTTRIFKLVGDGVDQVRFSCVVPATRTLGAARTKLDFRDCSTEAAYFVHILGLADGTTVLVVSAPTDQPESALADFCKSVKRASREGRLSSALLRFVLLSNKGLALSTAFLRSLPQDTRVALEAQVLESQIQRSAPHLDVAYPGLPEWKAEVPPKRSRSARRSNDELIGLSRRIMEFEGRSCGTHLSRWLRACAANRLGEARIGTSHERTAHLTEACRAVQLSGPEPDHAKVLTLLGVAAVDKLHSEAWLDAAESCLASAGCSLNLGSLDDVRFGLIRHSRRHRRSLFLTLETTAAGCSPALRTFVATHAANCMDQPLVGRQEDSERLTIEVSAVLAMAEAAQHRRAARVAEALAASRRAIDITEGLGLRDERVQLVHQRAVLDGIWAQTKRKDWDDQLSPQMRQAGNWYLGEQYRHLAGAALALELRLFGPSLSGTFED